MKLISHYIFKDGQAEIYLFIFDFGIIIITSVGAI